MPLRTVAGEPFVYAVPALVERHLHRVDRGLAGSVGMAAAVTADRDAQRRYLVNSRLPRNRERRRATPPTS